MWRLRRRGSTPGRSAADEVAFGGGKDVYFYLHMGCCMISWSNFLAQRNDFGEYWMYTPDPNRAVNAWHYMAGCIWRSVRTCFSRLIQHTLRIEPHDHGKLQSPTGSTGSCTLSRQCTICYKSLITVVLSDLTAICTRLNPLDTSVTVLCHCYHGTATKAALKFLIFVMSDSVDPTEVGELCSDQKHLSLY
jgi:hypothetical protein